MMRGLLLRLEASAGVMVVIVGLAVLLLILWRL